MKQQFGNGTNRKPTPRIKKGDKPQPCRCQARTTFAVSVSGAGTLVSFTCLQCGATWNERSKDPPKKVLETLLDADKAFSNPATEAEEVVSNGETEASS